MYPNKKRPRVSVILRHVFNAAPDGKINRDLAPVKRPKENGNQTELF